MPSLVLSLFAVFLFSGIIVYNYMQVTMLADQAAKLEKELTNLKSEEVSMRAEQEKMFNLNYIEDYAKNNLDMVKADEAQIDYIQLSEPDQIQVLNGKNLASGYFSGFIKTFNVVVEYLN